MPASRAVLHDIAQQGLDPAVAYRHVGHAGQLRPIAPPPAAHEPPRVVPLITPPAPVAAVIEEPPVAPEVVQITEEVTSEVTEPVTPIEEDSPKPKKGRFGRKVSE